MLPSSSESHPAADLMAAWGRAYARGTNEGGLRSLVAPPALATRGEADARAAWQRWHDPTCEAAFPADLWPWYALLERARVEVLAGRDLPGIARNLAAADALAPPDPAMARLYLAARGILGDLPAPEEILLREDKPGLAEAVFRLLPAGIRGRWTESVAQGQSTAALTDLEIAQVLRALRDRLHDSAAFAEGVRPLAERLARFYRRAGCEDSPLQPPLPDAAAEPDGNAIAEQEDPDARIEVPGHSGRDLPITRAFPGYSVFSSAWDETYPAAHWLLPEDARALKSLNAPDRRRVRQLAHRLQRRLQAARLRHWSFDQEEGRLDSRRLARLVGDWSSQRVFRIEEEAPVPEACVTLLVDQSGSMRGERQRMAALAIDLAVHSLEVCQVRCEVLGFTTRFRAGNPVSDAWRRAGAPGKPGRLNALRHIIYKTPDQPWRRARPQLGLLLREAFGNENVDGEALHWAAHRLAHRPQARKVLLVLCDGAPYDEDTAGANGREYLENHLRAVIAEIEASPIHLLAIGTGQEVGRFYRQALTVRKPDAVAEVLFERLGDLLTRPGDDGSLR